MTGKIAKSIIIKVGHGIMEIPRKTNQLDESDFSSEKIMETHNSSRQTSTSTRGNAYISKRDEI